MDGRLDLAKTNGIIIGFYNSMKKIYFFSLFICFIAHTSIFAQLSFLDTLIDLNTVAHGAKIQLYTGIYNHDTVAYQLTPRHICGCTEFEKGNYTIPPKSYLQIPFAYNSSGNAGHINRGIYIDYSGLSKGTQKIRFIVNVDTINSFTKPAIDTGLCLVFDRTEFYAGTIWEGNIQQFKFTLYNCSSKPMIITNVQGSCGCVMVSYDHQPISLGKTAEITAHYNSVGRGAGLVTKSITVTTFAFFGSTRTNVLTLRLKAIQDPNHKE
jgi:hypothetical protein